MLAHYKISIFLLLYHKHFLLKCQNNFKQKYLLILRHVCTVMHAKILHINLLGYGLSQRSMHIRRWNNKQSETRGMCKKYNIYAEWSETGNFFEKIKIRALKLINLLLKCTLGSPNLVVRGAAWGRGPALDPLVFCPLHCLQRTIRQINFKNFIF